MLLLQNNVPVITNCLPDWKLHQQQKESAQHTPQC